MAYEKQLWEDDNKEFPLAAARMRHLENGISGEEERALAAEKTIQISVGAEQTRATAAEANLHTEITTVESGAAAEVKAEKARAEAAEASNKGLAEQAKTAVTTEKARAEAAEVTVGATASTNLETTATGIKVEIKNERERGEAAEKAAKKIGEEAKEAGVTEKARAEAAEATKIPLSQKGKVSGVAELNSEGKVPKAQLPPAEAIATKKLKKESELEPLAKELSEFPATTIVVVEENNKVYIWTGTYTTAGTEKERIEKDWAPLPTAPVVSVNGKGGAVELKAVDVKADVEGAANTAQANAEAAATSKVAAEETRAVAAEGTKLAKAENLKDLTSASTARTNLGLGSAAVEATSAFDAKGAATTAQANAESAAVAKVKVETERAETAEGTKLAKSENLKDLPSVSTARTNLGLGTAATKAESFFDLAGAATTAETKAKEDAQTKVKAEETRAKNAEELLLPKSSEQLIPAWKATTVYSLEQQVTHSNILYVAKEAHTSGTVFEESKWIKAGKEGKEGKLGPKGERGEMAWKEIWDKTKNYAKGDAVEENGSSYISLKEENLNHEPAGTLNVWWGIVAKKGEKGEKGEVTLPESVETTNSATIKLDLSAHRVFYLTLNHETATQEIVFENAPAYPIEASVFWKQDTEGKVKLSFKGIKWVGGPEPVFSTAANAENLVTFIFRTSKANEPYGLIGIEGKTGKEGEPGKEPSIEWREWESWETLKKIEPYGSPYSPKLRVGLLGNQVFLSGVIRNQEGKNNIGGTKIATIPSAFWPEVSQPIRCGDFFTEGVAGAHNIIVHPNGEITVDGEWKYPASGFLTGASYPLKG